MPEGEECLGMDLPSAMGILEKEQNEQPEEGTKMAV
jgi:hypothetical protein